MLLTTSISLEEPVSIGDHFYYADLNKVCIVEVARIVKHAFSTTLYFDVDFKPTCEYVIKKDVESAREFNITLNTAWNETHCPEEGSFIAFKKVAQVRERENWQFPTGVLYIAVLEIPKDAKRVTTVNPEVISTKNNPYAYKCRANKVKVLRIETLKGDVVECKGISCFYKKCCVYETKKMVYADSFDPDPENECSHGIHFFMRREDAVNY